MDRFRVVPAAGHVEEGESVFDAACREAAEEVGLVIAATDLVPATVMHRTGGNHKSIDERVDFFFECRRWQGAPRVIEPTKAADLQWFDLNALPEPVVPYERYVLDHLSAGTLPAVTTFGF